MNRLYFLAYSFLFFLFTFSVKSQEKGNYFLKHFDPKVSGINGQTWTGIEDNNGILYFASGTKIAIYDGKDWDAIQLKNEAQPLSFCKDGKGTIYVGGLGEIGYLKGNFQGKLEYVSLNDKIKKQFRDFQSVWTCVSQDKYVYFSTDKGIYSFNGKSVEFMNEPVFMTLNKIGNRVFFGSQTKGLLELADGKIKKVKNGDAFINTPIVGGIQFNKDQILFLSGRSPIIFYNQKTGEINKINNKLLNYLDFLNKAYVYSIEKTVNNKIVIGTIYEGLLVFDFNGNLINQFNTNNGLLNNAINKVFNDRMGNIWLCTDKSVARIEINSGIKNWSTVEGIEGNVEDIVSFKNNMFIATNTGVKWLNNGVFTAIQNLNDANWQFETLQNRLFVGNTNGLFEIVSKDKSPINIFNVSTVWSLIAFKNKLILGCTDGLYEFDIKSNAYKLISSSKSAIRGIAVDDKNNIWFATDNKGVGYIDNNNKTYFLSKENGLLYESYNQVFSIKGQIYVATKAGLFKYNYKSKKLAKACDFGDYMCNEQTGVFRIKPFQKDYIFTSTYGDNTARFSIVNVNNKERDTINLKQLPKMHIYSFYEKNDIIWLGSPYGLYQYNKKEIAPVKFKNKTLIRKVFIGKDSLLFGGFTSTLQQENNKYNGKLIPEINYDLNSLNFIFTNPFFNSEDKIVYQYKLEGFDNEWSSWSEDNFKSYTNLFEGKYTFLVRAQNVFGQVSEVGKFSFRITPPWYRTILAYILYLVAFVLIIYLFIRIYTRRLRKANLRLEKIVEERTAEVVKQRDEIQEKNELITESIEYAKTIQEAIITSDEYFKNLFEDQFVLFKPKDIVSGDFYWAYKTKSNKIFWVAADCTGHGVPGAFMTMIGMSLLNEIIIEKEIEETNEILDILRDSVIKTLNKNVDLESDDKMRNGMDIAICCWNLNTQEISYSGANNPMYILRNGELIEFKADKQPIGIYKKITPFTQHKIEAIKGDKIYIFSDGYADQMNEDERRFKIANLKNTILEIGTKSSKEQKEYFDSTYENWKGNYEQMDDVVLIGVEL